MTGTFPVASEHDPASRTAPHSRPDRSSRQERQMPCRWMLATTYSWRRSLRTGIPKIGKR